MGILSQLAQFIISIFRLLSALVVYWLRLSHPEHKGVIESKTVGDSIEIIRDPSGVAHVFAETSQDAFWGSGFVHAQDRLWQMETFRRFARGQLAELAGESAFESDLLMRKIGLHRVASGDVNLLDSQDLQLLEAYVQGVAAGVNSLRSLPPEFHLTGTKFHPWSVEDVMITARLILFSFAGNWRTELIREKLLSTIDQKYWGLFEPVHPDAFTASKSDYAPGGRDAKERLLESYNQAKRWLPVSTGASNAWTTQSILDGKTQLLLAGDPHVELRLPGLFHVSHIRGGDFEVTGAGIAGIPGVLMGHNESVAWSITAGTADVADCVIEEISTSDVGDTKQPLMYITPDGPQKFKSSSELIGIKRNGHIEYVEEAILESRHGPIISPLDLDDSRMIALSSTALTPSDVGHTFIRLMRATTVEELSDGLKDWPGTTFNFVMADIDGNIGYRLAGKVFTHKPGEGLFPRNGSESLGISPVHPAEVMPAIMNPADRSIVSANQAAGSALELGEDWAEPRRAERIQELLNSAEVHSPQLFKQIQCDQYSANLVALRDILLPFVRSDQCLSIMNSWDGSLATSKSGGSLLSYVSAAIAKELSERITSEHAELLRGQIDLNGDGYTSFSTRNQGWVVTAVSDPGMPWFRDQNDYEAVIAKALEIGKSKFELSINETDWFSTFQPRHSLYAIPIVGRLWSSSTTGFGGDINTVAQGAYKEVGNTREVIVTAGYRQVLTVDCWDESEFSIPTGISGIPGHPNYLDLSQEFSEGEYRPLLWRESSIRETMVSRLLITKV